MKARVDNLDFVSEFVVSSLLAFTIYLSLTRCIKCWLERDLLFGKILSNTVKIIWTLFDPMNILGNSL